MAAGFPQTKSDIDNRAGSLAVALRDDLYKIQRFKELLDTKSESDLVALGYSSGDVATLKSAYAELADLAGIYQGQTSAYLTGSHDYRVFAKQLTGVA